MDNSKWAKAYIITTMVWLTHRIWDPRLLSHWVSLLSVYTTFPFLFLLPARPPKNIPACRLGEWKFQRMRSLPGKAMDSGKTHSPDVYKKGGGSPRILTLHFSPRVRLVAFWSSHFLLQGILLPWLSTAMAFSLKTCTLALLVVAAFYAQLHEGEFYFFNGYFIWFYKPHFTGQHAHSDYRLYHAWCGNDRKKQKAKCKQKLNKWNASFNACPLVA